jgi:hypothetical protein
MKCHKCYFQIVREHDAVFKNGRWWHRGCWNAYKIGKDRKKCECGHVFAEGEEKLYSGAGGQRICAECKRCETVNSESETMNQRIRRLQRELGRYIDPFTVTLPARNYI